MGVHLLVTGRFHEIWLPWFDNFDIDLPQFEPNSFTFDGCGNIQALCLKDFGKSDS